MFGMRRGAMVVTTVSFAVECVLVDDVEVED